MGSSSSPIGPRPADGTEHIVGYQGLVKRLNLPTGWAAPTELTYEDVRASALTRNHLHDDVRCINASIELIRRTRGGRWPTEPVSEDFNYVDLVWHECEFREGDSFSYAVYDAGEYLGCCYLYPMGRRTPLTDELLGYDVDVSWWVTPGVLLQPGNTDRPAVTITKKGGTSYIFVTDGLHTG